MNKYQNKMKPNYTLAARTYPVFITLLPLIIIGSYYSIELDSYYHIITSIGVFTAFSFLLTQIGRDFGKKIEPKLWKQWGGSPSVQILRFSNGHIDIVTKSRYHKRLQQLCPVSQFPTKDSEELNPNQADDVYGTWTKFMIANTRDTNKFKLLFKENINYGFRRNLLGFRPISIVLIFVLLGTLTATNYYENQFILSKWPKEFFVATVLLLALLLFWLFIVNSKWVERVGFSYAERLFELTETIVVL